MITDYPMKHLCDLRDVFSRHLPTGPGNTQYRDRDVVSVVYHERLCYHLQGRRWIVLLRVEDHEDDRREIVGVVVDIH